MRTKEELLKEYKAFMTLMHYERGLCWQTVNSDYSSIQKFFKNVVFLDWNIKKIPSPRKEKKLPNILSKEDVVRIMECAPTFKQQVLLTSINTKDLRAPPPTNQAHIKSVHIPGKEPVSTGLPSVIPLSSKKNYRSP